MKIIVLFSLVTTAFGCYDYYRCGTCVINSCLWINDQTDSFRCVKKSETKLAVRIYRTISRCKAFEKLTKKPVEMTKVLPTISSEDNGANSLNMHSSTTIIPFSSETSSSRNTFHLNLSTTPIPLPDIVFTTQTVNKEDTSEHLEVPTTTTIPSVTTTSKPVEIFESSTNLPEIPGFPWTTEKSITPIYENVDITTSEKEETNLSVGPFLLNKETVQVAVDHFDATFPNVTKALHLVIGNKKEKTLTSKGKKYRAGKCLKRDIRKLKMQWSEVPLSEKAIKKEIKRLGCRLNYLFNIYGYPDRMGPMYVRWFFNNPLRGNMKECKKYKM